MARILENNAKMSNLHAARNVLHDIVEIDVTVGVLWARDDSGRAWMTAHLNIGKRDWRRGRCEVHLEESSLFSTSIFILALIRQRYQTVYVYILIQILKLYSLVPKYLLESKIANFKLF